VERPGPPDAAGLRLDWSEIPEGVRARQTLRLPAVERYFARFVGPFLSCRMKGRAG
jgi:hypothetical protein